MKKVKPQTLLDVGLKNLLSRWLETKRDRLRDAPVKIGNMVFHIPYDGENYLLFKCAKCGKCCRGQRQNALMLTFGDIERLAEHFKMTQKRFVDEHCIFASTTEGKEVYPLIGGPPAKVQYTGCYLKRFKDETVETVFSPYSCQFITKENLCSIYPIRPVVCRKFPYITNLQGGLVHAYYVDVPWSECEGYKPKLHIKKQWLSPWVKTLEEANKEILDSVQKGLLVITEIGFRGSA
jgi:Fe-S-cluster containining protein